MSQNVLMPKATAVWLIENTSLSFDQIAFFAGLHVITGAGLPVLIGGWIAKIGAVVVDTVLVGGYLVYFERRQSSGRSPKLGDIFDVLTYRERYEDLLVETRKKGAS